MQKIEHLNDIVRIQSIFRVIDFELEYSECAEVWMVVSMEEARASWIALPESDTDVLKLILKYFDLNNELFNNTYNHTQYLKTSISLRPLHIKKES